MRKCEQGAAHKYRVEPGKFYLVIGFDFLQMKVFITDPALWETEEEAWACVKKVSDGNCPFTVKSVRLGRTRK